MDIVRHVEAKYPALLFKQQLIAYVEKIYGIIRENMKKDMLQIVPSCIQVWQTQFSNTTGPQLYNDLFNDFSYSFSCCMAFLA